MAPIPISPSALARAICPIVDECGGCGLLHLSYHQQLEVKRKTVQASFAHYPELASLTIEPTRGAFRTLGYRTRAKLACQRDPAGGLRVGLYAPGTHEVTDVGDCPVLHPRLRVLAAAVRELFRDLLYTHLTLSYVSLRHSEHTNGSHLTLVVREDAAALLRQAAITIMARVDDLGGVSVNLNPGPPLRVFGSMFRTLAGEERLVERLGDREYELSPGSFFQANPDQANAIVDHARAELGHVDGAVVDLYAGAGVLGLGVVSQGAEVVLIEAYDQAADDARRSAERNGFSGVTQMSASAEKIAPTLAKLLGRAGAVIVNPPRKGCAPAVLKALAALRPKRAIYVSCDPTTLARDLAYLYQFGYGATRVVPFDMLPGTDHVEAVATLRKLTPEERASRSTGIALEDNDLLVVGLAAFAADAPALAVTTLDENTSGAVLVAKNPEVARRLRHQLAEGTVVEQVVCLVKGVTHEGGRLDANPDQSGSRAHGMRYRRLEVVAGHSLLAVSVLAGQVGALRRRLLALEHPVIGDDLGDPPTNRHFAEKYAVQRLLLHVFGVVFAHPRGGARVEANVPLAGDFRSALLRLKSVHTIGSRDFAHDLPWRKAAEKEHTPRPR